MKEPGLVVVEDPRDWLGEVLSGKYRIRRAIGTGAMGTIYEAENTSVGRRVAIKVLAPQYARHREALARFHQEARSAAGIQHPNIVDVFDMGETAEGTPYIVMEYLEGEDLLAYVTRASPVSPDRAVSIVLQILAALEAAHGAGVVHRDVKPENVFLVNRGHGAEIVKVLDFGVSQFRDALEHGTNRLTRHGSLVGTPSYMAPELARGSRLVDVRTDVYATGVVLYEMLSGRLPHPGDSYSEVLVSIVSSDPPSLATIAPSLSAGLVEVVERAMAREPSARFASAAELRTALEPYSTPESVGPSPSDAGPLRAASFPSLESIETVPSAHALPWPSRRLAAPLGIAAMTVIAGAAVLLSVHPIVRAATVAWVEQRPLRIRLRPSVPDLRANGIQVLREPGAKVVLRVATLPSGARVSLDGHAIGSSPLDLRVAPDARMHVLRLEAAGFPAMEQEISLTTSQTLSIPLEPPSVAEVRRWPRPAETVESPRSSAPEVVPARAPFSNPYDTPEPPVVGPRLHKLD